MSIFIGSTPNTQEDDLKLAKEILRGKRETTNSIEELTSKLDKMLGYEDSSTFSNSDFFLFNRGRESLFFFLSLLGLEKDDEIVTQAFTCVAVVAPILWNDCKPVYVDIDTNSFNMDINLLEEKITDKTRAIIIQHTFGNLANVRKVREIVDETNNSRTQERKIYIIEDCAHVFTPRLLKKDLNENDSVQIGRYSDAYFFSFSQDKAISCTQGAMMKILNSEILNIAKEKYKSVPELSKKDSLYNAKYIKLWSTIKKYYFTKLIPFTNITLGRVLIIIFRTLGLIKRQATVNSTNSTQIKKMSDIQALLLLNQVDKVKKINNHRQKIVDIYNQNLKREFVFNSNNKILLRYPILISNREEIKKKLLEEKIIAGNWYSSPIHPLTQEEDLEKVNYINNPCPVAVKAGKYILNLPTNIEVSERGAMKTVEIVNNFAIPFNI
jgi:perosamine synthetase